MLRRCSACGMVGQVTALQRNGQPWDRMWCHASNAGFTTRRDPAESTIADLAADMARHNLTFVTPAPDEPLGPGHRAQRGQCGGRGRPPGG